MKATRARATGKELKSVFARAILKAESQQDLDAMLERMNAPAPKQARSVETTTRLLDAAEQLLEQEGLDAATVPAIAERAGVSVGVVYRRFADKDTLLRAVWERFLDRQRQQTNAILAACEGIDIDLEDLVRATIRGSIDMHRKRRNLLLALRQFARAHADASFRKAAHDANRAATAALAVLMLRHRDRIDHPHPEAAIEFGVLAIASVIQTVIIDQTTLGLRAPVSLEDELTRMILGYLGI